LTREKQLRYRRKIGDRSENILITLKTTISSKFLSTSDNDQSLIKSYKFIITKLLYVNIRRENESINILESQKHIRTFQLHS